MTKNILLLAAVVGFGASSVFAADPTPTPMASATPAHKTHHKTHHKKAAAKPSASPSATPKA